MRLEERHAILAARDEQGFEAQIGKGAAADMFQAVAGDFRAVRGFEFGFIWRRGGHAREAKIKQGVTRVENRWGALATVLCEVGVGAAEAVVGEQNGVRVPRALLEFARDGFPGARRQRLARFVIDAENLLLAGVRPAGEKTRLRGRGPTRDSFDTRNVDLLGAQQFKKRAPRGIVRDGADRQHVRAEIGEIIQRIRAAARERARIAMPEDQYRRLARYTRNLARNEQVEDEIAGERDRLA